MRFILWFAAGCMLVGGTFIWWHHPTNLWPSVTASSISAIIFILLLFAAEMRSPISARRRIAVLMLTCFAILVASYSFSLAKEVGEWRRNKLLDIRSVIGRGSNLAMVSDSLLKVLEHAYRGPARSNVNLKTAFASCLPGVGEGDNFYHWTTTPGDSVYIWLVTTLRPEQIEVIAIDRVGRGINAGFRNANGLTGRLQQRFTLTPKGLRHDTDN